LPVAVNKFSRGPEKNSTSFAGIFSEYFAIYGFLKSITKVVFCFGKP